MLPTLAQMGDKVSKSFVNSVYYGKFWNLELIMIPNELVHRIKLGTKYE